MTPPTYDDLGASRMIHGSAITIDTRTGPFHGVYSKPGYTFEEALIHLPGETKPPDTYTKRGTSTDTVYVYMGGESKTGGAVDAGFQHSAINDDWILFVTCEGFGFRYDEINRFVSNQDIKLRFSVPANNYIVVSATGRSFEGEMLTRTVVLDVSKYPATSPPAPDGRAGQPTGFLWRADGEGVILKRMTSIAQTKQSFQTQSYTKHISWRKIVIGRSQNSAKPWTASFTGATMNWPDTKRVVVQQTATNEEVVGIFLNR